jgi:inorganic triphosphatase YgiF
MSAEERELKLTPVDADLLERLWNVSSLGPFTVVARRQERQRNSFFDTRERALRKAGVGFRRRTISGDAFATWTLKAEGGLFRGIATRPEIELRLGSDLPPALAIGALRQAAQQRGAAALAEQVADALSSGPLPLAQPVLETETERRLLELRSEANGWHTELALDSVRMLGHPKYAELEIEVELKRGDDAALEAARAAIEALGAASESHGSKLGRAYEHLDRCQCSA